MQIKVCCNSIFYLERERNARTYHNKTLLFVLKLESIPSMALNHHLRKTDEFKITGDFRGGVLIELLYFCFLGIVVKKIFPLSEFNFSGIRPCDFVQFFYFDIKLTLSHKK